MTLRHGSFSGTRLIRSYVTSRGSLSALTRGARTDGLDGIRTPGISGRAVANCRGSNGPKDTTRTRCMRAHAGPRVRIGVLTRRSRRRRRENRNRDRRGESEGDTRYTWKGERAMGEEGTLGPEREREKAIAPRGPSPSEGWGGDQPLPRIK